MKRYTIGLITLLLIVGCSKKPEGVYNEEGEKNGKWTTWYEPANWYSSDSEKKSEGVYDNGEKVGEWTYWYENGKKSFEGTYKDGKLDGLTTEWYENGQKSREETYKDGKLDGLMTYWDKDGSKYEGKVKRKDDEDGTFLYWYDDMKTKIQLHITFKDGEVDGLRTEWYENGQKSREETYKDGNCITCPKSKGGSSLTICDCNYNYGSLSTSQKRRCDLMTDKLSQSEIQTLLLLEQCD